MEKILFVAAYCCILGIPSASINLHWIILQFLCNKTRFIFQGIDGSSNFHDILCLSIDIYFLLSLKLWKKAKDIK